MLVTRSTVMNALAGVLLVITLGCGDDGAAGPDAGFGDGAGPDATVDECAAPAAVVGGTPATDQLADAPARCGLAPYAWRRDPALGAVVARTPGATYTAQLLGVLASAGDVVLPAPPSFDVEIEVVTYDTQDRGAAVTSSAVVIAPTNLPAGQRPPVLLMLHGTSGFRRGCGPSTDDEAQLLLAVFASYGWLVVAPDYLGLESAGPDYPALHPYLVGEPTAIASLYAVRAGLRVGAARGLCPRHEVAVFGGSQGGHAALWVDRLAPYYARELTMLGAVATVPASDLVGHTDRALRALVPATGNVLAALSGAAPWYGLDLGAVLDPPWSTSVPAALEAACEPDEAVAPPSLQAAFTDALLGHVASASSATFPGFGCVFRENSLLDTSIPRLPTGPSYGMLWILGQADTLIVPSIERAAYDELCAAGMPLAYQECSGAGHTETTAWSISEILTFLDERRRGVPFTASCQRPSAARCSGTPD